MKKQYTLSLYFILMTSLVLAQDKTDTTFLKNTQWNYGISLSPQMLFVGGVDLGVYTNLEHHLSSVPISMITGMEIRNKWFHANISNGGLDTRSLKTDYSMNVLAQAGIGYSFKSKKKEERNSFYITATPYYFAFQESVNNPNINNTSNSSSLNSNIGLLWSSSTVTKKGRIINTQFYIPIFGRNFLDELRVMSLRVGLTI